MATVLNMTKIDATLALHQRQWSIRRIAKELGLHRDTVARHIQACEQTSNQSGALLGSDAKPDGSAEAKQATHEGGRSKFKTGHPRGAPIGSKAGKKAI